MNILDGLPSSSFEPKGEELSTLLSVSEARQRLLASFTPVEAGLVPLALSSERVLAEDIYSNQDLPLFDNSSMDGFAVRSTDVSSATPDHPVVLQVVGDIPAGSMSSITLQSGESARIMTGAPLPAGADAVVPVEDTDQYQHGRLPEGSPPSEVSIFSGTRRGGFVRSRGQDVQNGQKVLAAGVRLRPQDLGLLAMLGFAEVPVREHPRVAIVSTGDELLPVGEPLLPGKIHDSNAYTLAAAIRRDGGETIYLGIVPDLESAVHEALEGAIANDVDLIISSAGVSVGAFDFVRSVVEEHGKLEFWRVNMRPGKPLAFGSYRETPFIGLPGNPVSAFVGYEVFVRPALLKMAGLPDIPRKSVKVQLEEPVESDGRESYLRAIVHLEDGRRVARLTGHQGSGNLLSLVQANALLIIPSGVKSLPANAEVNAWMLGDGDS